MDGIRDKRPGVFIRIVSVGSVVKRFGRVPTENTEDTESDSEFFTTDGTDEHGCSAITEIPALSA